ncbi:FKBP-type peptidyl-prolyl cis-trans isomerase [Raoultibacter phocaeensis]|uniref:FKBP-type peptidyl-prolyl cis-trans isomerase n=1 Tax=Raoultibacter phocaeensis TaxID=2479841 RepID=UPI00111B0C2A|nr:FKBP-type peptidyl-prolyl cis-trans isomerase [Raoultibacter phocaeensis]
MDNSNKMVKVSYVGTFDDGSVFIDQSTPIEFPCIDGWMPPAFIDTVRDMEIGETRTAHVGANEAYEERTDERILEVPREKIPPGLKLPVGKMVNLEDPTGQTFPARVIEVTDEKAVFDMNHDAIAKALNFTITLLAVTDLDRC